MTPGWKFNRLGLSHLLNGFCKGRISGDKMVEKIRQIHESIAFQVRKRCPDLRKVEL
jgi:hypothetical protein